MAGFLAHERPVSIDVRGSGFWLVPPTLPLATPVRIQLHRAGTPSRCWEASYAALVRQNDAGTFRAGNDPP